MTTPLSAAAVLAATPADPRDVRRVETVAPGVELVEIHRSTTPRNRREVLRRQRLIGIIEIDQQRHRCAAPIDETPRRQRLQLHPHLIRLRIGLIQRDLLAVDIDRQLIHRGLSVKHRLRRLVRPIACRLDLTGGLLGLEAIAGVEPVLVDPGADPEAEAATRERLAALHDALGRLPPRLRLLVRLRYEQELPLEEVARLAGLSGPSQVERQIRLAFDEVRVRMDERGFAGVSVKEKREP